MKIIFLFEATIHNHTLKENGVKLLSAMEQGIITEQTKQRLKELEAQISQLDFDIEQEKQRSYTYLSKEDIKGFLRTAILGDKQDMGVRKLLVNTFVREVILYDDSLIITYNFTERYHKHEITKKSIKEVEKRSNEATSLQQGSHKFTNSAPCSQACLYF